jgi:hypothetical protein
MAVTYPPGREGNFKGFLIELGDMSGSGNSPDITDDAYPVGLK